MNKILLIIVVILVFTSQAFSGSSIRCQDGNDLLIKGESMLKAIACLGEPAYKEFKVQKTKSKSHLNETKNTIESWFYSIDGWSYCITIINGVVENIETIGRE